MYFYHKHGDILDECRRHHSGFDSTFKPTYRWTSIYTMWKRIPINLGDGRESTTLIEIQKSDYQLNKIDYNFLREHYDQKVVRPL